MYAFRKPFTAGVYLDIYLWGLEYKTVLVFAQVAGYTISKFLGIKYISELKAVNRVRYIFALVGVSWLALLFFAIVPHPFNWPFLILNGLPLGMIWGVVFSFLEGRKNTDLLAAGLASSFIVASGFVKSIGKYLVIEGISEFWMPFFTGAIFIPSLCLGVFLLSIIPPPSEDDISDRTARRAMNSTERKAFFLSFAPGIVMITLIYMALTAYRDFRDNFAVEIWTDLGYGESPEVLTLSEIPIAITVLILSSLTILIKNHRKGFYINLLSIHIGGILAIVSTALFQFGIIGPLLWMIAVGFAMYLPYMYYNTVFFERWLAFFKYSANIGFLIYICDSFGYLSSLGVMLFRDLFFRDLGWVNFFIKITYGMGFIGLAFAILSLLYFLKRERSIPRPATDG